MRAQIRWLLGGALALTLAVAQAQEKPAPLMRQSFEESEEGWMIFGTGAKIGLTREASHVKEGKAALQYDYNVAKGEIGAALLPLPEGALAKAKAIRFWILADHTIPLFVTLQERGGGRYVAACTVPRDRWQQVELALADFALTDGPDDPKDPNNQLDADQIEAFGLFDLSQLLAQADNPALADLFNVKTGPRTLYLDDLTVTEETLPNAFSSVNGDVRIDRFIRPQLTWIAVGDVTLSRSTGKPLEGPGLQADYRQAPGKIMGLVKGVRRGGLAGTERLTFSVASAKPAKLVVQVEEPGGGKYNTIIDVPGDSVVQQVSLAFSDFNPADDSRDDNNRLDLEKVHQVLILDASGLLGLANQDNTLWINNLRASAAK